MGLCKRVAEGRSLRREARAGPHLSGSVFGPQRVERQVPAVDRAGQHLNHHPKISVQLPALGHPAALDPAVQASDIRDPGGVERGMHLDVEIGAEFQAPKSLRIAVSPSMTEVLLCWPVKGRGSSAELEAGHRWVEGSRCP